MNYLLTRFAQLLTKEDMDMVPQNTLDDKAINNGLQIVFGSFAAVAVLIIAIAAFRIVISRGNPQDVSRSRDAIIYASIGLAISMAAFIIVAFVVEGL